MAPSTKTFEEQFFSKIEYEPTTGCWLWTGALDPGGYSVLQFRRETKSGHRVGYQQLVGPIPDGLHLDHKCRTRCCVNPAHLEPVTPKENTRRSPIHAGAATHCPSGHEYSPENTRVYRGERLCRACLAERQKSPQARASRAAWMEANKEKMAAYQRDYYVRSRRKQGFVV